MTDDLDLTDPAGGTVDAEPSATVPRFVLPSWPELIVDIRCADLYATALGDTVGHPAPVVLDVARLVSTGARSVLHGAAAIIFGGDRLSTVEPIERVRAAAPHMGIFVLVTSREGLASAMPLLTVSGIDDVLTLDVPDASDQAGATVRQRLAAPAPETEIKLLWRWFRDSPERTLLMHCVRNAYGEDNWALRTTLFGASRRTLQSRLAVLGLPSPGLVARCGRMLHAQELERRGVKPARDVALAIGIPSAAALHRARRRLRRSLLAKGPHALVFASLLR